METLLDSPVRAKSNLQSAENLAVRAYYRPSPRSWRLTHGAEYWCYSRSEQDIILALAAESLNELSIVGVKGEDEKWSTNGGSVVRRYELEDGTAGYFKPLRSNSKSEYDFHNYGMSSLAATISELNAYRMAQLLGGSYAELVPTTALRRIDGEVGTLQLEVKEEDDLTEDELMADYRRASLLDFLIGNLDRHSENFIYGADSSGRRRIRLIDNSFSFPGRKGGEKLNQSVFASGVRMVTPGGEWLNLTPEQAKLTPEELTLIRQARSGVEGWLSAGTIGVERGKTTLKRIDALLTLGRLGELSEYFYGVYDLS